jgi:hypothetical protein
MGGGGESQRGQGTIEYLGAVLAVALLFVVLAAALGPRIPGGELARALVTALTCAIRGPGACDREATADRSLASVYGSALAAAARAHAPNVLFEESEFVSLPVDFRSCRERACADSIRRGLLKRSQGGEPATAFLRVIDCSGIPADGVDCSGSRAGFVYLQYWLYYPDSATHGYGRAGYHLDDWESFQVRISADGEVDSRASSHRGYNGRRPGLLGPLSDAGAVKRPAWTEGHGYLRVAAGSHAGMTMPAWGDSRGIRSADLRLIPLEPIAAAGDDHRFAVTPPWRKRVWSDPESPDT